MNPFFCKHLIILIIVACCSQPAQGSTLNDDFESVRESLWVAATEDRLLRDPELAYIVRNLYLFPDGLPPTREFFTVLEEGLASLPHSLIDLPSEGASGSRALLGALLRRTMKNLPTHREMAINSYREAMLQDDRRLVKQITRAIKTRFDRIGTQDEQRLDGKFKTEFSKIAKNNGFLNLPDAEIDKLLDAAPNSLISKFLLMRMEEIEENLKKNRAGLFDDVMLKKLVREQIQNYLMSGEGKKALLETLDVKQKTLVEDLEKEQADFLAAMQQFQSDAREVEGLAKFSKLIIQLSGSDPKALHATNVAIHTAQTVEALSKLIESFSFASLGDFAGAATRLLTLFDGRNRGGQYDAAFKQLQITLNVIDKRLDNIEQNITYANVQLREIRAELKKSVSVIVGEINLNRFLLQSIARDLSAFKLYEVIRDIEQTDSHEKTFASICHDNFTHVHSSFKSKDAKADFILCARHFEKWLRDASSRSNTGRDIDISTLEGVREIKSTLKLEGPGFRAARLSGALSDSVLFLTGLRAEPVNANMLLAGISNYSELLIESNAIGSRPTLYDYKSHADLSEYFLSEAQRAVRLYILGSDPKLIEKATESYSSEVSRFAVSRIAEYFKGLIPDADLSRDLIGLDCTNGRFDIPICLIIRSVASSGWIADSRELISDKVRYSIAALRAIELLDSEIDITWKSRISSRLSNRREYLQCAGATTDSSDGSRVCSEWLVRIDEQSMCAELDVTFGALQHDVRGAMVLPILHGSQRICTQLVDLLDDQDLLFRGDRQFITDRDTDRYAKIAESRFSESLSEYSLTSGKNEVSHSFVGRDRFADWIDDWIQEFEEYLEVSDDAYELATVLLSQAFDKANERALAKAKIAVGSDLWRIFTSKVNSAVSSFYLATQIQLGTCQFGSVLFEEQTSKVLWDEEQLVDWVEKRVLVERFIREYRTYWAFEKFGLDRLAESKQLGVSEAEYSLFLALLDVSSGLALNDKAGEKVTLPYGATEKTRTKPSAPLSAREVGNVTMALVGGVKNGSAGACNLPAPRVSGAIALLGVVIASE